MYRYFGVLKYDWKDINVKYEALCEETGMSDSAGMYKCVNAFAVLIALTVAVLTFIGTYHFQLFWTQETSLVVHAAVYTIAVPALAWLVLALVATTVRVKERINVLSLRGVEIALDAMPSPVKLFRNRREIHRKYKYHYRREKRLVLLLYRLFQWGLPTMFLVSPFAAHYFSRVDASRGLITDVVFGVGAAAFIAVYAEWISLFYGFRKLNRDAVSLGVALTQLGLPVDIMPLQDRNGANAPNQPKTTSLESP